LPAGVAAGAACGVVVAGFGATEGAGWTCGDGESVGCAFGTGDGDGDGDGLDNGVRVGWTLGGEAGEGWARVPFDGLGLQRLLSWRGLSG